MGRAAAVTQGAVAKGRSVEWQDIAANDGACSLARSLGGRCDTGTIGKKVEKAVASCE